MVKRAIPMAKLSDSTDIVQVAGFVIGMHQGDQRRRIRSGQQTFEFRQGQTSFPIEAYIRYLDPVARRKTGIILFDSL